MENNKNKVVKKVEKPDIVQEALQNLSKFRIGKEQKPLTEYITKEDLWVQEGKKGRRIVIMAHEAIERLAEIGNVEIASTKLLVSPLESNEQQHVFLIQAISPRKSSSQIGEASIRNTSGLSRRYLATMAYKRGYDKAVLKSLEIEGVYSAEEADEFVKEEVEADINNQDLAKMQEELGAINRAKTPEEIVAIVEKAAKEGKGNDWGSAQKTYFSTVFARKYAKLALKEDEKNT